MARSAGEHEFREILVRIYPQGDRATVSVHTRKRRGSDVVWERRLGAVGVEIPREGDDCGVAAVLRLAAAQLLDVAQRADT